MKNKVLPILAGILIISFFISSWGRTAVQTIAGLAVAQSSTLWNNVKDAAFGDNATTGVLVVNPYLYDGTNFDRARGDTTNGLDVDVTRVSGSVTVIGNNTPTDNYTTPTDALDSDSFLMLYDGSTWDMARNTTHADNITTTIGLNSAAINYLFDGTNYDRWLLSTHGDNLTTATGGNVAAFNYGFDGTNWDRVMVGGAPSDNYTATQTFHNHVLNSLYDGTNWDLQRSFATNVDGVSAVAVTTSGISGAVNFPYLYNGATFDRALSSTHGDNITTAYGGNTASINYLFDGTNYDRAKSFANNVDDVTAVAVTTSGISGVVNYVYEFDGSTYDRVRNQFVQSTTGITTNAAGTTVTMTTTPMSKFTMVVDRTAGATNTVEVDLECSVNNTAFVQIATITDLTNEPVLTSLDGTPCAYMRYNVITVGAGNTLSIGLLAVR